MKQELRQIYDDLFKGLLSQKEALERVKAIKLAEQGKSNSTLLASPVWQPIRIDSSAAGSGIASMEHHVILCALPKVNLEELRSLLPQSRCWWLQAGEQKNIAQQYSEYALACFERIQTILRSKPQGKVLVHIVVANHLEQVLLAGLWGMLKTATLENPQLIGQLVLVAGDASSEELSRQLHAEMQQPSDRLVRYEKGVRQVLLWEEVSAQGEKAPIAFKDQGVYLITGGLGGLGLLFAKEIVKQTSEGKVVLTGRSALNADKQNLLDKVATSAGRVSYRQVDLGKLEQVKHLIASIAEEYGQIKGILHSAGMVADNFILKKSKSEFSEVLGPKVTGTYNLDQATQEMELDFFVLFSSIAGAMGNVGQADYAAANGFMDQFARYRNGQVAAKQRHGLTRSINWGAWQAGGMGTDAANWEMLQEVTGMQAMQTATGMEAFYRSLILPCDQMLVAEGDGIRLRRVLFAGGSVQPKISNSLAAGEPAAATEADATVMDMGSLVEKTQDYLRKQLSELLRLPSHKIDPRAALENYGIDSILAMKLTNKLERTFGSLSKTLFFEYQTINELTKYFTQSHLARLRTLFVAEANGPCQTKVLEGQTAVQPDARAGRDSGRRSGRLRNAPGPPTDADPIAITGLSGRYPEAINIE